VKMTNRCEQLIRCGNIRHFHQIFVPREFSLVTLNKITTNDDVEIKKQIHGK